MLKTVITIKVNPQKRMTPKMESLLDEAEVDMATGRVQRTKEFWTS